MSKAAHVTTQHVRLARFGEGKVFVLHGITGTFSGRISAWFDAHGQLLEAEQYVQGTTERPVKRNGPIWSQLQRLGKVWASR